MMVWDDVKKAALLATMSQKLPLYCCQYLYQLLADGQNSFVDLT